MLASEYISVSEAAAISGLTITIIRDRARKGKIGGIKKISDVWLIPREWAIKNKKVPSVSDMARAAGTSRVTAYKKLRRNQVMGNDKRDIAYTFGRLYAVIDIMTGGEDRGIKKHYDQYVMFPGQILPEMLRVVNLKRRDEALERALEEIIGGIEPEDMKVRLDAENQAALMLGEYHERAKHIKKEA